MSRLGSHFVAFFPSVSHKAAKSIRSLIRSWRLHCLSATKVFWIYPACSISLSVVGLTYYGSTISLLFTPYLTSSISSLK